MIFSIALYFGLLFYVDNYEGSSTPRAIIVEPILKSDNPYDICFKTWSDLNIIDFGYFSRLAYHNAKTASIDLNVWLNKNYTDDEWVVREYFLNESSVKFFDFYSERKNLSVISIRGTQNMLDSIQDADLWMTISLFQIADLIFPTVSVWPLWITYGVVQYTSVNYWFDC